MTGTPVLIAERLKKTYKVDGNDVYALTAASLSVEPGEMVALRGRSGSGKSTLLTLLGLLARPDQGALRIVGQDALTLGRQGAADLRATHIGFVFQSFNLLSHLTALENVSLAARPSKSRTRSTPAELLERAGLGTRIDHRPAQLSGGEQQRVALVRALINQPDLILADEPTGNLDAESEELVLAQLHTAAEAGCGVVVASHSDIVCKSADRIIGMDKGTTVE